MEKPEKMVMYRHFEKAGEPTPSECYEASDYARNAALDVLVREGKYNDVKEVLDRYGDDMGNTATADPLDILRAEEELEDIQDAR